MLCYCYVLSLILGTSRDVARCFGIPRLTPLEFRRSTYATRILSRPVFLLHKIHVCLCSPGTMRKSIASVAEALTMQRLHGDILSI